MDHSDFGQHGKAEDWNICIMISTMYPGFFMDCLFSLGQSQVTNQKVMTPNKNNNKQKKKKGNRWSVVQHLQRSHQGWFCDVGLLGM